MHAAFIGVTEKEYHERCIDEQKVFDRMILFLAAIVAFLFIRVFGARDASLGAIMAKRGAVAASTSVTDPSSRPARPPSARLGAPPNCRKAVRSTGSTT